MSASTVNDNRSENNQMSVVRCKTNDGAEFSVPWDIIKQAKVLDQMCRDLGLSISGETDGPIGVQRLPIFEFPIKSSHFGRALDWCKHHVDSPDPMIEIDPETREQKWFQMTNYESEFFSVLSNDELAEIMACANYLDIHSLYVYCCQAFAARLRACKTPKEVCAAMGIEQDLTEDEQEEIQRQNVWNSVSYSADS
ncbi:skp1 family, dimerization domain-containing protein [Ditylenchus destructor]|uniref:Skp1-related protein n=1 Tax=Ditylenchus destructor TaxID=166010 RepID=A0AAD4NJ69_9BILA|nr:skp1 family, dimerization domain-containing protein [Ditylenchus destructor]